MDQLKGYEFMFVFMPYMHTEKYEYSRIGKQIYERYKSGGEAKVRKLQSRITPTSVGELRNLQMEMKMLKEMQIHVLGHFQTLMQYGRFPKRNEALGRKSTEQEIYYMERPEVKKRPY